jgi:hypothetical protein
MVVVGFKQSEKWSMQALLRRASRARALERGQTRLRL